MTTHRYPRRMEIKRHRLLEAAQEIFLEKGFHAASMSDIAKKAEVSPPHIYNFYKNKADLAMAVQERMNQEIYDTLKNSMFEERSIDKDECLDNLLKPERAALMLTLITEATRDAKLMEHFQKHQKKFRELLYEYYHVDPNDEEHKVRLELLNALYAGLAVRSLFSPYENKELLKELLGKADSFLARKHPVDHMKDIEVPAKK